MDEINRRALLGAAGMASIAAVAGSAKGGPLNPPSAAVAPTGRTLDEVFNRIPAAGNADGRTPIAGGALVVVINAPGSYVLTGNITVSAPNTLVINASDVVVDLNGYTVQATAAVPGGTSVFVVLVATGAERVVVRNGALRGGTHGVRLAGNNVACIIEDLRIDSAKLRGVAVAGGSTGAVVRRCSISNTGATSTSTESALIVNGIEAASAGLVVEDCIIARTVNNSSSPSGTVGINVTPLGVLVAGCRVVNAAPIASTTGISVPSGSAYRENFVANFAAKYAGGGTDGGGNL